MRRPTPRFIRMLRSDSESPPPPDPVGLGDGERVLAALGDDGALMAHLLGPTFALGARTARSPPSGWKNIDESMPRQRPDICQSQMSALGAGGDDWAEAWQLLLV